MKPFRDSIPSRTCQKKYTKYNSYKHHLQSDFRKRCGYCDDVDTLCGGARGFHIDHFRPQDPFVHLKTEYSNLVYSCPYCNGGKSNDWPSGDENVAVLADGRGYLDPCDPDFDNHFERTDHGLICAKTAVGKYMFKKLKLGLRRHQLAWAYEQLGMRLEELGTELNNAKAEGADFPAALEHHLRLTTEYLKYKHWFEETL